MSKKNNVDSIFSEKLGLILAGIGLTSIVITSIIFIVYGDWTFSNSLNESKVGQFGDFIGGVVGSLFALSGVILYYVALKEQRKEIGLSQDALNLQIEALNHQVDEFKAQKEELEETRKVYIEQTNLFREQTIYYSTQTKEYIKQTNIANLQQFDSSFYSILGVLNNLRNSINEKSNGNYFDDIYLKLKSIENKEQTLPEYYYTIIKKYIDVFYENNSVLSHYFKTIYRIIKMIDASDIQETDKKQYAKIFRSQLTDAELLILYYNYHSILGNKVRVLAIKYELFKHIQILDKIELNFDKSHDIKGKLSIYINIMSNLIKSNLIKYNDIESTSDINIREIQNFLDLESEIALQIDTRLCLTISFTKEIWENQQIFDKKFVKEIISKCIYDILYLSKFRIPIGNEIETSFVEFEQNIEFRFIINEIENI